MDVNIVPDNFFEFQESIKHRNNVGLRFEISMKSMIKHKNKPTNDNMPCFCSNHNELNADRKKITRSKNSGKKEKNY